MANTESKGQGRQQSTGRCLKESRNRTVGLSGTKVPRMSIRIKKLLELQPALRGNLLGI